MWSQNTRSTLFFRFQMPNSQTTSVYGVLFCRALVFDALMDAGCWLVQVGCIVRHSQLDAACTCCVYESVSTISRFHFTFITLRVISMHFKFFCLTLLMRGSIWLLLFFCSWFVFCCCCLECPQQNTYNNHYFLHERQTQEEICIEKQRLLRTKSHQPYREESGTAMYGVVRSSGGQRIHCHPISSRCRAAGGRNTFLCHIPRLCVRVVYMERAWIWRLIEIEPCYVFIYKHFTIPQIPFEFVSHGVRTTNDISHKNIHWVRFNDCRHSKLYPINQIHFRIFEQHFNNNKKIQKQKY